MSNYAQQYDAAKKKGTVTSVNIEIKRWEKENEILIGKVLAVEKRASDTFDADYNQYLLETDNGFVATIFGAGVDMIFKIQSPVGRVFAFTFMGKRKLDSGKTMNVFTVDEFTMKEGGK